MCSETKQNKTKKNWTRSVYVPITEILSVAESCFYFIRIIQFNTEICLWKAITMFVCETLSGNIRVRNEK